MVCTNVSIVSMHDGDTSRKYGVYKGVPKCTGLPYIHTYKSCT